MSVVWAVALWGCGSPEPKPVPPPSAEYVGTWKSRDETVRLVLTADGRAQYTRGKWTNTTLVVQWSDQGFYLSDWPEPELHEVTVAPHDQDGYLWMTVDDVEVWRQATDAVIAPTKAPEPG
jgi:hypothetical protein